MSTELHEHGKHVREVMRQVYSEDIERLTSERDRAREECGHEKAMRASQREELMHHFAERQKAEAAIARVVSVCSNTDGDWLDGEAEIPVGEVLRMLYPDGTAPDRPGA